jgi:PKD repeat protein
MDLVMGLPKQRAFVLLGALFCAVLFLFLVFRPGDQDSAGIDLGDPSAWVEHGLDGELLQINALTGEITARVEVAAPGDDFTAVPHGYGAVLLNQTNQSVSLVSGSLLTVTASIPVELSNSVDARNARVFGALDEADNVVVLDDDQLLIIDPQSSVSSPIALKDPLSSAVQDASGRVVALRSDASKVLRLDARGLDDFAELVEPVGDSASQRTLVRAGGSNFVVDPARLSLAEIRDDGTLGAPVCMTSAASGAITGGSGDDDAPLILAYNPDSSMLNVSDPGSGCSDIDLDIDGTDFGPPVASDGFAYLPNWGAGRIVVVDLLNEQVVGNVRFGSQGLPFELEVFGSNVWANEPQGPFAAVIDASGIRPVAKISSIVAGSVAVDTEGEGSALTGGDVEGSGLLVIGDSGAEVIAASPTGDTSGIGPGNGTTGASDDEFLNGTDLSKAPQPEAVGIAINAPGVLAGGLAPDVVETLIANFGVSSAKAIVGEVLRFNDFSSGSPTSWTWDFGDGTGSTEPNLEKSWQDEGVYLVTLIVTNARGDQSIQSTEITIVPVTVLIAPTADFTFDRNTIEEGESVSFESRTVGEADLLEWDFGDGETAVGPEVGHTYNTAGRYPVTLAASNPAGATSASTIITVLASVEPPRAAIAPPPPKIVNGQFVTLRSASLNEPTRLTWDFGDGSLGSGTSVQHKWAAPGNYRVRLTVENSAGTDSTSVDVVVTTRIDPPVSQFTQSATEVLVGEAVSFTNLSLNEPTRLIWNFGDATTARGQTASKSWSRPGRYRVTLRATNEAGTDRTGVTITVTEPVDQPVAAFKASRTVVAPGTMVDLTDASTNNPTSWSWNFGDGEVSSTPNTSHQWVKEGTYTVRLTVSNEGGSSSTEREIVVKDAPSANFRWAIRNDGRVKFTDTSWDDPQNWEWDFGDGETSTDRSPVHRFDGAAFDVTLVVSNDAGTSAPKTRRVTLIDPPVAKATCKASGSVLTCNADGSRDATGFTWRSPDAVSNSTPNQSSTNFMYNESGRFDVTLIVSNEVGGTDSVTIRAPRVRRGLPPRVSAVNVVGRDWDLVRLEAQFDRNPSTWDWKVDGAVLVEGGNSSRPLFRVPSNGIYSGQVTLSNLFGSNAETFAFTMDTVITTASFDWEVVEPGVVRFRNTSASRGDAIIEWSFGEGGIVLDNNPQSPVVSYPPAGGTFLVVLFVEDFNGSDVARVNIDVPPTQR